MKQTFALLLMLTILVSCKKEKNEDKSSSYEQLVEGTWYKQTMNGIELSPCEKQSSRQFLTDGTVRVAEWSEGAGSCGDPNLTIDGTYTVDGNTLNINLGLGTSSGTYSISNGILTTNLTSSGVSTKDTYDRTPG